MPPVRLPTISLPAPCRGPGLAIRSGTVAHPLLRATLAIVDTLAGRPTLAAWFRDLMAAEVVRRDHAARLGFANDNGECRPW